ncbi:Der1-like protein [Cylindrobasidium torrendii FP15055 ss-10]|uniref:Derlin n=1 Tax=Cylindrobasidium torrendii FP15055 ss-10 TaxID=1314674 RepID=A0A0D7B926_9AGAR|nr:Der1-like protein [Cylindrobasidium torrendii FP15055 ss-10]
MPGPLEWLTQIPPVTRSWLIASLLVSVAVHSHIVTPLQLYFSPSLTSFSLSSLPSLSYRPLTTFLYFGSLSIDLVFHLFFFMRYSRILEDSSFPAQPSGYLWLLIQSAILLLGLSAVLTPILALNTPFLSSSLAFVPIYVWARRHPSTPISLFGLITITAPYLPFALVAFTVTINGEWKAAHADLMGCVVGHVAWFVRDVWKREMLGGPSLLTDPPVFLQQLLGEV